MRLGGPVYVNATEDLGAWVNAHKQAGYGAAYVPGDMSNDQLSALAKAAEKGGLVLAEVGAWSNPISTDAKQSKEAIELCCRRLAQADLVGARCCVNIAGSRGERWDGPHHTNLTSDTMDLIVQSVREIIDTVNPQRTFYTLEPMPWVIPDSPQRYLDLLRAVDRKHFAVHMDIVNMINCPSRAYDTAGFIRECFGLLGPDIKSCHVKDIRFSQHLTVHLDECRPGEGVLDMRTYLREVDKLDPDMPFMLEHLPKAEEYVLAAQYVRSQAAVANVKFR